MKYSDQEVIEILKSWKLSIDNMKESGLFSIGDARMKKEMLDLLISDFTDRQKSHEEIESIING